MKNPLVKKLFFALGVIMVISLIVLGWRELQPKKPIPDLIELPERGGQVTDAPLDAPLTETTPVDTNQPTTTNQSATTGSNIVKLLFDQPLGFISVAYPYLYAYDYTDKNLKAFDLENKTFRELYGGDEIGFVSFSPFKNLIAFKRRVAGVERFYLLDLIRDKVLPLNFFVKKINWGDGDDLFYYYSNNSGVNYIGRITNGQDSKLLDLGLLNPSFEFRQGKLLSASERQSPLFMINPSSGERQTLVTSKPFISFKSSLKYLFVSYPAEGNAAWKSFLLSPNGSALYSFNWGTLAQKCSLKEMLICGVPTDQNLIGLPEDWLEFRKSFSDRLIVFDPTKSDLREVSLGEGFDVVSPEITPLGVIFQNRLDSKVYLVPLERLSSTQ